jgi:hypothetical protein
MTALRRAHNRILVFFVFAFTCMKGALTQELRRFLRTPTATSKSSEIQRSPRDTNDLIEVASLEPLSLRGITVSPTLGGFARPTAMQIEPYELCDCDLSCSSCGSCSSCSSCSVTSSDCLSSCDTGGSCDANPISA